MTEPFRVVVVTKKSAWGAAIVRELARQQLPIEAIVLERGSVKARTELRRARAHRRRSGTVELLRLVRRKVVRRYRRSKSDAAWTRDDFYRRFGSAAYEVDDLNAPDSQRLLGELDPDLIVLGTSRILRSPVLSIPRVGVLNAHPGLLPAYRGVDVIAWAIHNGDPVGVTIHFVDPGVDTGDIVAQQTIDLRSGDTLSTLKKRAGQAAAEHMADTVRRLMLGEPLTRTPQRAEDGKQYYRMPLSLREQVQAMIPTKGEAQRD
ncbi:MAG: formyl transferase [Acidimicrobiia bacterium]|nr:formyl transferase [Acidimicrobiia bacterium]